MKLSSGFSRGPAKRSWTARSAAAGTPASWRKLVGCEGLVLALDRDPDAVSAAERRLAGLPVHFVQANFCELPTVLAQQQVAKVDGILLDLGMSSDQLADQQRGFSFDASGPLDLRFDPQEGTPAWTLVNRLDVRKLADLIFRYGEEPRQPIHRPLDRRCSTPRADSYGGSTGGDHSPMLAAAAPAAD